MRLLAILAAVVLIVINWDDGGAWVWFGVVLLVLNVAGLVLDRRRDEAR